MRAISEIKGEEAMELSAILISIGRKITTDKELKKYVYGKKPQGVSAADWNNEFAAAFYDVMLNRYSKDCAEMLAKIEGVSREEYLENLDTDKLFADLDVVMADNGFRQLFFALAPSKVTKSGSGSESTKAQKA